MFENDHLLQYMQASIIHILKQIRKSNVYFNVRFHFPYFYDLFSDTYQWRI